MRLKKDFTFSGGAVVKVHEVSSADIDSFDELIATAEKAEYTDNALAVYAKLYYPVLFACTDNPPSLEESYAYDHADIDAWFAACCEINPDWLGTQAYREETIKLNGKKITVKSRRPSTEMRLAKIQQDILKETPLENPKDEEYRITSYSGVAAASFGNVPTAYEAKHELSLRDFGMWHATVRKLIPEWYGNGSSEEKQAEAEEKKSVNAPAG